MMPPWRKADYSVDSEFQNARKIIKKPLGKCFVPQIRTEFLGKKTKLQLAIGIDKCLGHPGIAPV